MADSNSNGAVKTLQVIMMVIGLFTISAGSFAYLNSQFATIEARVTKEFATLDRRLIAIEAGINDRWTSSDMRIYTYQLRQDNPELTVPDVHKIKGR